MKSVRVIIEGDVQGVGFRAWVRAQAQKLQLTGWVKNRADRTVELVATGEKENVEKLVAVVGEGPETARVKDVQVFWDEPVESFEAFTIIKDL